MNLSNIIAKFINRDLKITELQTIPYSPDCKIQLLDINDQKYALITADYIYNDDELLTIIEKSNLGKPTIISPIDGVVEKDDTTLSAFIDKADGSNYLDYHALVKLD